MLCLCLFCVCCSPIFVLTRSVHSSLSTLLLLLHHHHHHHTIQCRYLDSEPDTSSTESEGSEDYDENEEWANQYEAVILGDDDFWSGQLAGVSEEQALDNFTDKIFDALDKDGASRAHTHNLF